MIAVIGAGPSGIEAAYTLAEQGRKVLLLEKSDKVLTNLRDKAFLFPDFQASDELVYELEAKLSHPLIEVKTSAEVVDLKKEDNFWSITVRDTSVDEAAIYTAEAVLLASGYSVFNARRKEELGYGIYKSVITSLEMEAMLKEGLVKNTIGESPKRVAFLQCVGSRDAKTGNNYCSKLCCVTAAKQAIELRKLSPETEIYIFYMDLRMWGEGFEEMYRSSQQDFNVHYIRGRISEAAGTFDGRVQIKAEDTLTGFPVKMNVDLLVLMLGMEASMGTKQLSSACGVCGKYGFAKSLDSRLGDNRTAKKDLYLCGSCKRPMTLSDVLTDARSAAIEILKKH